jgi:O-antigen ligase
MAYLMLLTFSRTGLALVLIALLIYFGLHAHKPRSFIFIVIIGLVGMFAFSQVVDRTGEAAVMRYTDMGSTNRTDLIRTGLRVFADHPLFGVGTSNFGATISADRYYGSSSGAHNELVRAAAEHGILGLIFWIGFAASIAYQAFAPVRGKARAIRLMFIAVCFAYTLTSGLKLMTQPLLILLAASALLPPEADPEPQPLALPDDPYAWLSRQR